MEMMGLHDMACLRSQKKKGVEVRGPKLPVLYIYIYIYIYDFSGLSQLSSVYRQAAQRTPKGIASQPPYLSLTTHPNGSDSGGGVITER